MTPSAPGTSDPCERSDLMPNFYFDLVTDDEFQQQGSMILEALDVASERADQLASELRMARPQLRERGWAIRVTNDDGEELYRTGLDTTTMIGRK